MSAKVLLIAVFVACCWYATLIDTASVRKSEDLSELLQRILEETNRQNHRVERATDDSNVVVTRRICQDNMPCGWSVYTDFTRNLDYYMKNVCECPDTSYKCVRAGDYLAVSAFIYRCRQNTTADDIEAPEESS